MTDAEEVAKGLAQLSRSRLAELLYEHEGFVGVARRHRAGWR